MEEYKEPSWAAMSELEKELQQMEAQYGKEFGDASESEEEELDIAIGEKNGEDGSGRCSWSTVVLHRLRFVPVLVTFCFCLVLVIFICLNPCRASRYG